MKPIGYRGFIRFLVLTVIACMVVLCGLNLFIDPFYVFRTPFFSIQYQINERFAKMQYLLRGHRRFDGFILGSSRIVHTNPRLLEEVLPGARFYNFSTAGATPWEHLLHVKYMVERGMTVRRLFVGIDVDLALTTKGYPPSDYLFRLHPHVVGQGLFPYYASYLTILPEKNMRRKVTMNLRRDAGVRYHIEGDGTRYNDRVESLMSKDPEGYVRGQASFHVKTERLTGRTDHAGANLEALRELSDLCRKRDIALHMFINPCHRQVMDSLVIEDYLWFLRELARFTDYWDFGGYNSVTTDSRYYIDSSHYGPAVSRLVIARMFGRDHATVPPDFGSFVEQGSAQGHLERLRKNLYGGGGAAPGGGS